MERRRGWNAVSEMGGAMMGTEKDNPQGKEKRTWWRICRWGGEMRTMKKGGEGMAMGDRMMPVAVSFLV